MRTDNVSLKTTTSPAAYVGTVILICVLLVTGAAAQDVFLDSMFTVLQTNRILYGQAPVRSGPSDSVKLRLDLYEPTGPDAPPIRPAFIAIHGGAFNSGSRKDTLMVRLCNQMAGRGYAAVSIDYRLGPSLPVISAEFEPMRDALVDSGYSVYAAEAITAASEDATTAHRYLVDNAAVLNVDTTRIAVGGLSAGAITSLNVAYGLDDFGISGLPEVGAVMDQAGALYEFVDHMESGEPPVVIVHGEADTVVDFSYAEALAAQALAVGIPYEFYPVAGGDHLVDIFEVEVVPGETIFDRIVEFLYEHLDLLGFLAGTEGPPQPESACRLCYNYPNPFRTMTTIRFYLPKPQPVHLAVFTVDGRFVKTLAGDNMPSGSNEVTWEGSDISGRSVAPGIYLYRLRAGELDETKRMVLLK
jgi:acetyl esterase/lipase